MPELQEQIPACPGMDGMPELQEQISACPWMDGMPELQEQISACPWMDGMPVRGCSRHPRTLPTSLWVGSAGAPGASRHFPHPCGANAGANSGTSRDGWNAGPWMLPASTDTSHIPVRRMQEQLQVCPRMDGMPNLLALPAHGTRFPFDAQRQRASSSRTGAPATNVDSIIARNGAIIARASASRPLSDSAAA